MAVSSDTCRSLNSPFVSVLLKIAEPSGQISQKSFEMTIPQFQVHIITDMIISPFQYDFLTNSLLLVLMTTFICRTFTSSSRRWPRFWRRRRDPIRRHGFIFQCNKQNSSTGFNQDGYNNIAVAVNVKVHWWVTVYIN